MKRFLILCLIASLMLTGFPVYADSAGNNEAEKESSYELEPLSLSLDVKGAILMEANTGTVLYAYHEEEAFAPASVTKVMTLLLIAEAVDGGLLRPEDTVSVSEYAASMGGSQVYLKAGERMTVEELIKCTVIASANDAAVALAERCCGSEEAFVAMMNQRAAELGLQNTHFENVTGLDDSVEHHVMSARDIAVISRELIRHPIILKYSTLWQDTIRDGAFTLTNTNRLVRYYDGCTGLKTGSTAKAGYCISATAERDGMHLIAVIMGAETRDKRNAAARTLLDAGFSRYALFSSAAEADGPLPVRGGRQTEVRVEGAPLQRVILRRDKSAVVVSPSCPEVLSAPLRRGDTVGQVTYRVGERLLGVSELTVTEDVTRMSFFDVWCQILWRMLSGGGDTQTVHSSYSYTKKVENRKKL